MLGSGEVQMYHPLPAQRHWDWPRGRGLRSIPADIADSNVIDRVCHPKMYLWHQLRLSQPFQPAQRQVPPMLHCLLPLSWWAN